MYKRITCISLLFFLALGAFWLPVSAKELVATIYGKPIYRDDLEATNQDLSSLLLSPLYERFAAENHLVATESEIDEFIKASMGVSDLSEIPEHRTILHNMAKTVVLNWKISKALYEKYGGEVIFQQANPLEPIGAERQFLEAQEKTGAFQILDSQERASFFKYYVQPQHYVVSPSKVNYERPWWLQGP